MPNSTRENWLTRSPAPFSGLKTLLLTAGLTLLGLASIDEGGSLYAAARATPRAVFEGGEAWRAWTSLFLHGDFGHLLSNLFLFVPLTYLLLAYFGFRFWLLGLATSGLVNLAVLKTMPAATALIGISGFVYWMGAAWLTFFLTLDDREPRRRRFGNALFLTLMLFVPETLKPEVSHLSHFLGFVTGVLTAFTYLGLNRRKLGIGKHRMKIVRDEYYPRYLWELDREWETTAPDAPEGIPEITTALSLRRSAVGE